MNTETKFSLGEKVNHINHNNNKVSKNNYVADIIMRKDETLYKLQSEDGVFFMSKSENLSKTTEVKS